MKLFYLSLLVFVFSSATYQDQPVVSIRDFKVAEGEWKGELTYLDYTSGKPFTMPANLKLTTLPAVNGVKLSISYPQEPKANGMDTLFIGDGGTTINHAKIVSKKILDGGAVQVTTDMNGVDGNDRKKAVLRHIYTISSSQFVNRKEVKFEGTDQWIMRNEYSFKR